MANQTDVGRKILNHQRFQSGMSAVQTVLMVNMTNEMKQIRRSNQESLAIQQEMLHQSQLQAYFEEFVYYMTKIVAEYSQANCKQPPSERFFDLKDIDDTVCKEGIGTAVIRGQENKAAFEKALLDVRRLKQALEKDPEVIEAIAWADAEQKRQEARRVELARQINELNATRKTVKFQSWYEETCGSLIYCQPPFDKFPILPSIPEKFRRLMPVVFFGFIWLPILFSRHKKKYELEMNHGVDREINKLREELDSINANTL